MGYYIKISTESDKTEYRVKTNLLQLLEFHSSFFYSKKCTASCKYIEKEKKKRKRKRVTASMYVDKTQTKEQAMTYCFVLVTCIDGFPCVMSQFVY